MWKGFGYGFIILLAGLQTIPVELYEAAEVDGADSWQQFKNITFPLLIPIFTTLYGIRRQISRLFIMTECIITPIPDEPRSF